jgi:hypothetical protein
MNLLQGPAFETAQVKAGVTRIVAVSPQPELQFLARRIALA